MKNTSDKTVPVLWTSYTPEISGMNGGVHGEYMADMLMLQSLLMVGAPPIVVRERGSCPFDPFWVDIKHEKTGHPIIDEMLSDDNRFNTGVSIIRDGAREVVSIRTSGPYIVVCNN